MKFGKVLAQSQHDMPQEMGTMFLRFKELKKQLKHMSVPQTLADRAGPTAEAGKATEDTGRSAAQQTVTSGTLTAEEIHFIQTLNEDLANFNDYFVEKEEVSIIRLRALEDRIESCSGDEELKALKTQLIDFHGELILLLHWSLLNYAAVVKILKKHDKRTGCLLRAPFLASVLQQPFYSTDGISKLVKAVEDKVELLTQKQEAEAAKDHAMLGQLGQREEKLARRTAMALGMWQELGKNASTPSTVLLPPAKRARLEQQAC